MTVVRNRYLLAMFSGIAGRLLGYFLPLLLGLILVAVAAYYQNTSRIMRSNLGAKGQALARTYAFNCKDGLKEDNASKLESPMLGLSKEPDIFYVAVYRTDGSMVTSYKKEEEKTGDLQLSGPVLEQLRKGAGLMVTNAIYDVYEPVKVQSGESLLESMEEEVVGYVRIGLSTDLLRGELNRTLRIFIIGGLLALAIASALVMFLAGRMAQPIKVVARIMEEIGSGEADLTKRLEVRSRDELGRLSSGFNSFAIALSAMVKQIAEITPKLEEESQSLAGASQQLTAASQEVTSTIQRVSHSSEKQLQDIKLSVIQAQQAKDIALATMESAKQVNISAEKIKNLSTAGTAEAAGLAEKIEGQAVRIGSLSDKIETFEVESRKISKIMTVIEEVAHKTTLLALNTAIEAAHAGEYGRSFNVIAIEVKNLAEMTKVKTDEIKVIVATLVSMISEMSQEGRRATQEVRETKGALVRSAETLALIARDISTATATMSDIYQKGEDSQRSVNSVAALLDGLAHEAESNAAAAEEVAAATEEQTSSFAELTTTTQLLSSLSEQLKSIVAKFKV